MIDVLVMQGRLLDFNALLVINAIKALGGVCITQYGSVEFEKLGPICAAICICKADFGVTFDEQHGVWVAAWKWSAGWVPEKLPTNWRRTMKVNCRLG